MIKRICDICEKENKCLTVSFSKPDFLPRISKDICGECWKKIFSEDGGWFYDFFKVGEVDFPISEIK